MHYAILNSSANALEWFSSEEEGRAALDEMLAESPEADLYLVAFAGPGKPAEPVTASARSAWPSSRLVWSSHTAAMLTTGNLFVNTSNANETDDKVKVEVKRIQGKA